MAATRETSSSNDGGKLMRTLSEALRFNFHQHGGMNDAGGKRGEGGSSGGGNAGSTGGNSGGDGGGEGSGGARSAEAQAKDREVQNDIRQQEKDRQQANDKLTAALKPSVVPGAIINTLTAPFRALPGVGLLIDSAAKKANVALDAAKKASVDRQVNAMYGGGSQSSSGPTRNSGNSGGGGNNNNDYRPAAILYKQPETTIPFVAPKTVVNPVPSVPAVGYYNTQVQPTLAPVQRPQTSSFTIDNKTMLYLAAGGVALVALIALTGNSD
jgi:hypothetical protein